MWGDLRGIPLLHLGGLNILPKKKGTASYNNSVWGVRSAMNTDCINTVLIKAPTPN